MTKQASRASVAIVTAILALSILRPSSVAADGKRFSAWSEPVNVGAPVNIAGFATQNPFISRNGLSLYFACISCPGGVGATDIWVSQRESVNDPWGPPRNLGPNINTTATEGAPALSPDELSLYFNRNPGGLGGIDIWVSRRFNRRDDFAWQPAVNLGSPINTSANDQGPTLFEDRETGVTTMYFVSNRPGGIGGNDIYASTLQPDGTFGPPELIVELSSAADDSAPSVRRDGLEIFFSSTRAGSIPPAPGLPDQLNDLWVSTRSGTAEPWSAPVNLGPIVNSEWIDGGPALSSDGTTLYFHSPFRPGNVSPEFNIWATTRRLKGHHDNHGCHHDHHHGDHHGDHD
jgi:hypothetical protein